MPDDHCWWCGPESNSGTHHTRDHLFKHCYKWSDQQAAMRAWGKEATRRGSVGDLLADGRYSPAVLDFLHVGRTAPPVESSEDEAEEAGAADEWRSKRSSDPRALVSGFICNFLGAIQCAAIV